MKLNKIITALVFVIVIGISSKIVCATDGFDANILNEINVNVNSTPKYNELNNLRNNVLGIIITVMQMLSVFGIVFCGIKYMYAGADQKAQLKKGLAGLAIGCIIVFSGATISKYVLDIFSDFNTNYVNTP
ncbi:MAG: hypothetical protein J6A15_02035 [Clostridia bacterium]|nr:hypothetical protein [Clostridia bacterium]